MAVSMYITLVALFFFWMCKETTLAYEMSFESLLEKVVIEIVIIWIGLALKKSQARAKVRAKLFTTALLRRFYVFTAMS